MSIRVLDIGHSDSVSTAPETIKASLFQSLVYLVMKSTAVSPTHKPIKAV